MTTQRTTTATARQASSQIPSEGPTREQRGMDQQAAHPNDGDSGQARLGFPSEPCVTTCAATNRPEVNEMISLPPATQNETWGFCGTLNEQASTAWPLAMTALSDATGQPLESIRVFLDSRHGRHFAVDVLNQLHAGQALADAIQAATRQWMGWKIGRLMSRDYGIPRGMPYLTGLVIHYEIADESRAA
jgi:hypothetical protein